jgi:nitroreductase
METLEAIKTRRSVRVYQKKPVEWEKILTILDAGRWAPSGLNNQPWKFKILEDEDEKSQVAEQTRYGDMLRNAPVSIAVFLDTKESYERTKDVQAIGACVQNMLLAAHDQGIGACWIGEILKNKEKVNAILRIPGEYELMAIVALGYPAKKDSQTDRKKLEELLWN